MIARFLQYPDCEEVMSKVKKLKEKDFGISQDLPKEILEHTMKMQRFKKAKEEGKTFYCSRAEPDKLFIDGIQV